MCAKRVFLIYIYTIHIYIKALYTYKYEIFFLYERLKRILTTTCVGSVYTSSATRPKTENWFQQFKNYIIWRHQNIFAPYRARIYKKKTALDIQHHSPRHHHHRHHRHPRTRFIPCRYKTNVVNVVVVVDGVVWLATRIFGAFTWWPLKWKTAICALIYANISSESFPFWRGDV